MGYPVLSVTETDSGIRVKQDRFLEDGRPESKDNETIWSAPSTSSATCIDFWLIFRNVPLNILTVDTQGKPHFDNSALLDSREKDFPLDPTKPFKLNAGVYGVCTSSASMNRGCH